MEGWSILKARKIIIPVSVIAGVAVVAVAISALGKAASATVYADVTALEKKTLQNAISLTGTVESTNLNRVFSSQNYPVESVNVEIGDTVKKGDILCTLNTEELQNQILQQQAVIDSNNINSEYQLSDAEKRYQDALDKSRDGTDTVIVNAEQSLENAKLTLEKAELDYNNALEGKNLDSETQLKSAELTLKSAKEDLAYYQNNYNEVKETVDSEDYYAIRAEKKAMEDALWERNEYKMILPPDSEPIKKYNDAKLAYEKVKKTIDDANSEKLDAAQQQLTAAEKAVESAEISLQSVLDTSESTERSRDETVQNFKSILTNAQVAYENAVNNYNLAVKESDASLASLKVSAEKERTLSTVNDSQVIILESYKAKLEDSVIKAPADGTVTSVGAVEGSIPSGVLFTVEDTENLKITASVSEYDITAFELGMPVTIKSDAISGAEYDGIISKIAPTAEKSETGGSQAAGTFAIEISVLSKDTELLIGMTAKLSVITEEKTDVYGVMYDIITVDEDGNDIIYIAEKTNGGYEAKALPVTVGMETDFEAEISGEGLTGGMLILTDNTTLYDGAPVFVEENTASEGDE